MTHADTEMVEKLRLLTSEKEKEPEISLTAIGRVLLSRKRFIAGTTAVAVIISAAVAFLLPPWFKAEASVLPPQQQTSSLAMLSGALGGLAGSSMSSSLGLKNPADLYVGILGSRTILDAIVRRFNLQQVYGVRVESEARKALNKHTMISAGKDSLIKIAVEDHDPKRAAELANAYIDELYRQNSRIAITDASQRRLFFEQEVAKEKQALETAELAMRDTEHTTGMLDPSRQAEALIHSGSQLRAEIVVRQVELEAMRAYATDENPQVQVLKKEISALQGQLSALEGSSSPSKFEFSAGKLPDSSVEYIRKARDFKYHEALFELLQKEYQAARIEEARQGPVLQVVDRAITPDEKSAPSRSAVTVAGTLIGILCACGWALLSHARQALIAAGTH